MNEWIWMMDYMIDHDWIQKVEWENERVTEWEIVKVSEWVNEWVSQRGKVNE